MEKSTAFVGLDVHKESIEIGIAEGGEVRHCGRCGGDAAAVDRLVHKLSQRHRRLEFVYEAGPCGFWIYRRLKARAVGCMVVSPSMMPRRPGDHIKTDRRDCLNLARLARAGELEAIYVPDARDEAMRDLVRTREDCVCMQHQARQRLQALLLRNDVRYAGKTAWTAAHRRWIASLKLPDPAQQIAFEEYVQSVAGGNPADRAPGGRDHGAAGALAVAPSGAGAPSLPGDQRNPRGSYRGGAGRSLALRGATQAHGLPGTGSQ